MSSAPKKKRAAVSYENMSSELAAAFAEKYPKGYNDYLPDLTKYPKPDGSCFYAVTVEIPDAIYLVKIKITTDNIDEINRWLESEAGDDDGSGGTPDGGGELPDDNISQYSTGDDDPVE